MPKLTIDGMEIEVEPEIFSVRKWQCKTRSNHNVATFIKELVLALPDGLAGLPPLLSRPETIEVNAWLCSGVTCMPPIDSFDALERALGR